MTERPSIHEDLSYVRGVVQGAERASSPAIVYFLWAVLTFFGYAIIDYRPEMAGFYWMIAGPLGGLASGYLAWRDSRALGESSRDGGLHGLHWTGMMVAILLIIPLEMIGLVHIQAVPRIILLIVAFAYYVMGIFRDRKMLWVGTLLAAAYLLSIVLRDQPWVWTVTAACMSCALVVAGILARVAARRPRESSL